jgi:hypothetical protein
MRFRTLAALATLSLAATACSSASTASPTPGAAPAPAVMAPVVNPVGRWSMALTAQGQAFDMTLELRVLNGAEYGGTITSQAFPPIPLTKATLSGNSMRMTLVAPTGDEATMTIVFDGDTFSGEWSMPGDGSRVSGRRIP